MRRLLPASAHSTCQSPSTTMLARPHCRHAGIFSTANPSGSKLSRPAGSTGRSHSNSTTPRPSAPRSMRITASGCTSVPSSATSAEGPRMLRSVARGGRATRIVAVSGGRLSRRMLASVIATRPSILTRLSTIDCGTAAFVTSAPIVSALAWFARAPIRMLAVPASPTSVTMLPAPPGCGSTRGGSDDGRTETSGLIRGVFSSTSDAVARGICSESDSWSAAASIAMLPVRKMECRRSSPVPSVGPVIQSR